MTSYPATFASHNQDSGKWLRTVGGVFGRSTEEGASERSIETGIDISIMSAATSSYIINLGWNGTVKDR